MGKGRQPRRSRTGCLTLAHLSGGTIIHELPRRGQPVENSFVLLRGPCSSAESTIFEHFQSGSSLPIGLVATFSTGSRASRKLATFQEISRKVAPFRSSYAGGLASGGGPGGGGSLPASGGRVGGGSGEVPPRTSLGVGGASGPVIPSGGIDVPTWAVSGVATCLVYSRAFACSATCLCVA
jgi:hypothetical protein